MCSWMTLSAAGAQARGGHDTALETVRQGLKVAGLPLNEKKRLFRQASLRFLGHPVTARGIRADTEHSQAVTRAPAPADAAGLRSFLGTPGPCTARLRNSCIFKTLRLYSESVCTCRTHVKLLSLPSLQKICT